MSQFIGMALSSSLNNNSSKVSKKSPSSDGDNQNSNSDPDSRIQKDSIKNSVSNQVQNVQSKAVIRPVIIKTKEVFTKLANSCPKNGSSNFSESNVHVGEKTKNSVQEGQNQKNFRSQDIETHGIAEWYEMVYLIWKFLRFSCRFRSTYRSQKIKNVKNHQTA
jgi:hypothetical protein